MISVAHAQVAFGKFTLFTRANSARSQSRIFARRPDLLIEQFWLFAAVHESGCVKVFGCRPLTVVATHCGAGVRKPPREETAGRLARWCVSRYGDFVSGGVCRTFVERVLRTRSRRLAGLIGRPRWAEPALSRDLLASLSPKLPRRRAIWLPVENWRN